jgi:predicted transcriptional regulator
VAALFDMIATYWRDKVEMYNRYLGFKSIARKRKMEMKNRSRIEITSLILEAANGGGARKTTLMNKARLSYKQLKGQLTLLIERDLIYYDIENQTLRTTIKGLRFLQLYNQIGEMMSKIPLAPGPR